MNEGTTYRKNTNQLSGYKPATTATQFEHDIVCPNQTYMPSLIQTLVIPNRYNTNLYLRTCSYLAI